MPDSVQPSHLAADLKALLERLRPQSVLCAGAICAQLDRHHAPECRLDSLAAPLDRTRLASLGRFDLVVLSETLETLPDTMGEHLLAALRDLHGGCFAILLAGEVAARQWPDQRLFALGMSRLRQYPDGSRLFGFDLATYKTTPEWLNPRFWANPEQWGRSWW